jgi:hypothetical protein
LFSFPSPISDDEVLRFDDENELSDDENEPEGDDHGLEDDDHELEGDDDIPEDPLYVAEDSDDDQSDDQSEVPDHHGEENGFNLFDCAKVVDHENLTLVYDVCTLKECRRSFSSRTGCMKHARACPGTKEIAATVRSVPVVEDTGKQQCSQCQQEFLLAASLEMHIKACHAEAEFACSHPDCHQDPTLYTEWSLNFHLLDQHHDAVFSCPFPGCGFFSRGRLRKQRVKNTISHLARRHAVSTRNIQNLQLLQLREVHAREAMTDPSCAYINVCANIAVEAPLVPLPPGIVNDWRPAGVKRDVQTDCDGIYEQVCQAATGFAGCDKY